MGLNKNKILFILHTSKTHSKSDLPQLIKIASMLKHSSESSIKKNCPFYIIKKYINVCPANSSEKEQFFVFSDHSPVTPDEVRKTLKQLIVQVGLNPDLYNVHSYRIGRGSDLMKLGLSVETIKKLGRWKSNTVFRYLRS